MKQKVRAVKIISVLLALLFFPTALPAVEEAVSQISISPTSFSSPLDVITFFDTPGSFPLGLASDGTSLWSVDSKAGKIYQSDTSGNIIAALDSPAALPFGIGHDGTYLWLSNFEDDTICKMDTAGTIITSVSVPGKLFSDLAYDGTYMWASDFEDHKIYKLDTSGNIVTSFSVPALLSGIAYDGACLWVSDSDQGRIYKLDTSGNIVAFFDAPGKRPYGLGYDGTNLWVSDDREDKIYQLSTELPGTAIGSSEARTFAITNSGDNPLVIDALRVKGKDISDFSIENDNCSDQSIAPSETKTFDVTFSPTSAGGKNAEIEIPSNDPDTAILTVPLSRLGKGSGYLVTPDGLWVRSVIHTPEGPIEAIWQRGGEDETEGGDRVIWGYFHASPDNVSWGSQQNPDVFVKIWFDRGGRVDVNFFHVSVPDIEVWSDYPYDGSPDAHGTVTMDTRYVRQYYLNGESRMEDSDEDGNPPEGYSPASDPSGYLTINDLRIGATISTTEKGPIDALWHNGGQDMTADGHQVLWGYFHASPDEVNWGNENNPDLFVKIWFDASGRTDVNFFHVSVPNIEVCSDFPQDGNYDEKGTTILTNRYVRHEY